MDIAETAIRECFPAGARGCAGDLLVRGIPCEDATFYQCCTSRPLVLVHRAARQQIAFTGAGRRCEKEFQVVWAVDYLRCVNLDECGCECSDDMDILDGVEDTLVSAFSCAACDGSLGKCDDVGVDDVFPLCPAGEGDLCKGFRMRITTCPDTDLSTCCAKHGAWVKH